MFATRRRDRPPRACVNGDGQSFVVVMSITIIIIISVCVYVYTCAYVCIYIYIYIYTYHRAPALMETVAAKATMRMGAGDAMAIPRPARLVSSSLVVVVVVAVVAVVAVVVVVAV